MGRRGAEVVVETLVAEGVRHLFTVSGNHVMAVFDATIGRDVRLLHTRHEASAVHMADAWGRLTGEPGVALVTGGPGHLNALSALYGALLAESPVVLLSGHCPQREIGLGAFQELDQVAAAAPVTKASWLATDPAELARDVARALDLARSGRPGPVHLSLPTDVLDGEIPEGAPVPASPTAAPRRTLAAARVAELTTRLAEAQRPLILVGPAAGRGATWAALAAFSMLTGIPALPTESPRGVNDPWLHGAARCLGQADLVLLLGKRLDFSLRFGQFPPFAAGCRFVRIDVEPDPADPRVTLRLDADPAAALAQLAEAARLRTWSPRAWTGQVAAARCATPPTWEADRRPDREPIHPLGVCAAIQPFLDAGAFLVSDGGEFGQWAQAGLEAPHRLINGPAGSIGSAVPMALAAKLWRPALPVFATSGDGSFGYAALEFDTALRYDLPIVAVVGNDARWNAEHQIQLRQYGAARTVGCELLPSRYDQVVSALGGHGELVTRAADLPAALHRAVASNRPACVNVLIEGAPAPTF